jgi:hypothetical protein
MELSLERLLEANLVARVGDTEWRLTPVGRVAAGYGLSWVSAKSVADGIRALHVAGDDFDGVALIILALLTEEIGECRCPNGATQVPSSPSGRLAGRNALWLLLTADDGDGAAGDRVHKLEAIGQWLAGTSLRRVEEYFARGANDDVVAGLFLVLLHRLGALLPAVGAIVRIICPELTPDPREVVRRLRLQLSIGGGRDAAGLHRLRLGLSRGQCLKLVELGIRDAAGLRAAFTNRQQELAALLSTPDIQRFQHLLSDPRHQARMEAPEPQLILEGFD